ncbi:MAG: hypothetical protein GY906_22495 [bacterium]|nr:hypothetical protein [bacterium]
MAEDISGDLTEGQRSEAAAHMQALKRLSRDWLRDGLYPQWEQAYKNYKAEPELKLDQDGKVDEDLTSLGSPMTFSSARRTVARVTAQIPNFRFRSSESIEIQTKPDGQQVSVGELIGRTQMFQWDRSRMQRIQKKHALQAVLFGWSPRLWHWAVEVWPRSKRVDIGQAIQSPDTLRQIETTYEMEPGTLGNFLQQGDIETLQMLLTNLLDKNGRGGLLPIRYDYRSYEGPKADFCFIGDCYPEPHFQSIKESDWFITNKFRGFEWLRRLARDYPQTKSGVEDVMEAHPKGMGRRWDQNSDEDDQELFKNMLGTIDRSTNFDASEVQPKQAAHGQWLVTARHVPGREAFIEYAVDNVYIGKIPYPYDLNGRMAITDCVLIDDIVSGIGDSIPRIMRGLHKVHQDQLGYRTDLIKNLLRPLVATSSRELLANPDAIKRKHGFRMMYLRDPSQVWQQGEMSALAAAQAGLAEDQSMLHQYFMFTGENSMSATAGVDPSQTRTAAGVRYTAQQLDVLTKDLQDMFVQSAVIEDAEIMWLLNRSELADGFSFEMNQYNRTYAYEEERWKEIWAQVEPIHFQVEGEINVEAGSTLADDSQDRQQQAQVLMDIAMNRPDVLRIERARDEMLIAMGRRHQIPEWVPQPPPPPEPEIKRSMSVSFQWDKVDEADRIRLREHLDLQTDEEEAAEAAEQQQQQGAPTNGQEGISGEQLPV